MSDCSEVRCTVCCNMIDTSQVQIRKHPILKVIICNSCYLNHSFGKFCLWCGSTEIYMGCFRCPYKFCKNCLQNNLRREVFNKLAKKKMWLCFVCSPSPISELKELCTAVMQKLARVDSVSTSHKRKRSESESVEEKSNNRTTFGTCCGPEAKYVSAADDDNNDDNNDNDDDNNDTDDDDDYDADNDDDDDNDDDNDDNDGDDDDDVDNDHDDNNDDDDYDDDYVIKKFMKLPQNDDMVKTKEDIMKKIKKLCKFVSIFVDKSLNFVIIVQTQRVTITLLQDSFANIIKLIKEFQEAQSKMKNKLKQINNKWLNLYEINLIIKFNDDYINEFDNSEKDNLEDNNFKKNNSESNSKNDESVTPIVVKKSPSKKDRFQIKLEITQKVHDLSTFCTEQYMYLLKFQDEFDSQNYKLKTIQLGYSYLNNTIDKTIDFLNSCKSELMQINQLWTNKFGVCLIKPNI